MLKGHGDSQVYGAGGSIPGSSLIIAYIHASEIHLTSLVYDPGSLSLLIHNSIDSFSCSRISDALLEAFQFLDCLVELLDCLKVSNFLVTLLRFLSSEFFSTCPYWSIEYASYANQTFS
jgi:hypothetical protein